MSNKYIIKNCPNCNYTYWDNGYGEVEKSYMCSAEIEWFECKDSTDCVLKQIVELCKDAQKECSCKNPNKDVDCFECTSGGRAELGAEILKLLDVQKVE